MIPPILPADEAHRLEALKHYSVLDTPPEQALDDLTALAAQICGTPIALVSLVDEHRQWFKSRVGMEAAETARDISFCTHTVQQMDLLIVPDATKDERFAKSPLVTGEPHIRFYAGAPLITPSGAALGALCVKDRGPRTLTPEQQRALRVLARQVMTHLELRRQALELIESEKRLRIVTEGARVGLVIVNRERRYVYANDAYAEILGLSSAAAIPGQRVADVLAGLYEEQIRPRLDIAFTGAPVAYDLHKPMADGAHHYAVRYEPRMVDGEVEMVVVVITEITERKQAEEALRESARFSRSIIDALSANLCVLDEAGTILATNEAWQRFAGANPQSAQRAGTGDNYLQICDAVTGPEADGAASFAAGIRAVLRGERREFAMEYACSPSSESRWYVGRVTRFLGDGPVRVVVAHENITERKQAEMASLRLAAIVASSDDAIIGKDLNGIITSWNRGAEKIFGYTSAEMVGTSIMRLIPADRQAEEHYILGKIRQGESVEHFETLRLTKDGRLIDVSVTASPIKDAGGKVLGVSKIARNITARKRNERRLTEQAALLDKAQDAILVRDLGHCITYWNKSAERVYGWGAEEVLGHSARELLYEDPAAFDEATRKVIEQGEWTGELVQTGKDGRKITIEGRWTLVRDESGQPCAVLAINTDITERKKLEKQFLRAQRMESIGTLAGGIAHDLNNMLSPIMMSLQLFKMRFDDPESQNLISIIETSANHGAQMVRQVLSFGRGIEGLRQDLQVKHLIQDMGKIVNETFLKHIQVRTSVPNDLWTVSGDATQIHQVLMNLCVNARDAMPGGGTLTLSAGNLTLDEQYAGMNIEANPGPYVILQVEDSGTGMPPEVIERIFDPFYTTKELGKGTGLGLSTTLAIVKSHGGFIRVYSEVGRGTKFKVYLPAQTEASAAALADAEAEMPRGHGELILVVDDEPSVREITQQTLEAFGYRAIVANDGADALAIYARRGEEIAAVLTDMMMPVMDGPATITVLQRINPKVRIIAASGLSANGHAANASSLGVRHFLAKPYTAETLLKVLKQVLAVEA